MADVDGLTWGEFKRLAEAAGATDDKRMEFVDITTAATFRGPRKSCDLSVQVDAAGKVAVFVGYGAGGYLIDESSV